MNRTRPLWLALLSSLLLAAAAGADGPPPPYRIEHVAVRIEIDDRGALAITERLDVVRNTKPARVIRRIPLVGTAGPLQVDRVTVDGQPVAPARMRRHDGWLEVDLGHPAPHVALYLHTLSYRVRGALELLALDEDRLCWQIVGREWSVPIKRVRVELKLPDIRLVEAARLMIEAPGAAYTLGDKGTRQHDGTISLVHDVVLPPGRALTLIALWPAGRVARPGSLGRLYGSLRHGPLALLLLWPLAFMTIWILRRWRLTLRLRRAAPKGAQPVAPPSLGPLEAGTLIDGRCDPGDVAAAVVRLAVDGVLVLHHDGQGLTLERGPRWDAREQLEAPYRLLADGLLGEQSTRPVGRLGGRFAPDMEAAVRLATREALVARGLLRFARRPVAGPALALAGFLLLTVAVAIHVAGGVGPLLGPLLLLAGAAALIGLMLRFGQQPEVEAAVGGAMLAYVYGALGSGLASLLPGGQQLYWQLPLVSTLMALATYLSLRHPASEWTTAKGWDQLSALLAYEAALLADDPTLQGAPTEEAFGRHVALAMALDLTDRCALPFEHVADRVALDPAWLRGGEPTSLDALAARLGVVRGRLVEALMATPRTGPATVA